MDYRHEVKHLITQADAGYVIGEDLIVTHEDSRHPLLPQEIDRIIEKYLI